MKLILILFIIVISQSLIAQTTYTFIGNGNWTVAANWTNNTIPPDTLPAGSTIIIGPGIGDSCVLNTRQVVVDGSNFTVIQGANFIIHGNIHTINIPICNQVWMTSNLNVSTYRNGDPILQITDPFMWTFISVGAWCWYNNDSATYAATYGKLYNWHAVNDPRGLAPEGWHVPSDSEWTVLANCLGGDTTVGGKMKSVLGWSIPNIGATNSSGFTALPAGFRSGFDGGFVASGNSALWWSTSVQPAADNPFWFAVVRLTAAPIRGTDSRQQGYSVRCVKD